MTNYLYRLHDSATAMKALEKQLLDRPEPTVLLHFGDHEPSFDGLLMPLARTPVAIGPPQWSRTYHMLKSNLGNTTDRTKPLVDVPVLDVAYLRIAVAGGPVTARPVFRCAGTVAQSLLGPVHRVLRPDPTRPLLRSCFPTTWRDASSVSGDESPGRPGDSVCNVWTTLERRTIGNGLSQWVSVLVRSFRVS
ncbi:MAG: hypothetical protein IPP82_04325 [Xanthomonadales bacterium]|nr:hypothetical protein [Xanthomonadales bacterium]